MKQIFYALILAVAGCGIQDRLVDKKEYRKPVIKDSIIYSIDKNSDRSFTPLEIRIIAASKNKTKLLKPPILSQITDPVTMYAVLRARTGSGELIIADNDIFSLMAQEGGVSANDENLPWDSMLEECLTWYKVEPRSYNFSNTGSSREFKGFVNMPFTETICRSRASEYQADSNPTNIYLSVIPSLVPREIQQGFGTMRYKVEFNDGRRCVKTAGADDMHPTTGYDNVFRISSAITNMHPLINAATLWGNVPYCYGSASPVHDVKHGKDEKLCKECSNHQSENFYSADCADMVSAALRKRGIKIGYDGTGFFDPARGNTFLIASIRQQRITGEYLDVNNRIIRFGQEGVREGDLVLWDKHIGILALDSSHIQVLPEKNNLERDGLYNFFSQYILDYFLSRKQKVAKINRPLPNNVLDTSDIVYHHLAKNPCFEYLGSAFSNIFRVVRIKERRI
ncbi:MAG: hypothetical protein AABX52_04585 [Nanoarchaeota archaeon]